MGVEEALASGKSELAGDLAAGVDAISSNQTITFTKYIKIISQIDGFVFWVKADLAFPGDSNNTFDAAGSLHYTTDNRQTSEGNYAVNRVVFTSQRPINELAQVGASTIWVGSFDTVKFAFSQQRSFYRQSGLYHYAGDAVYAVMRTQLIDSIEDLDQSLVVSNSIPIWLSMNNVVDEPWQLFRQPARLYPAFLSTEELRPPFGTVEVVDGSGAAIEMAPALGRRLDHTQLVRERVRITLWGLGNADAMDFVDFVNQYSLDTNLFGISNMPAIRDPHFKQVELGTLGKKKVIEFDINYNQRAVRDVARQLILSAVPTFILKDQ
jgi:hypothetical protein